MIHRPAHHIFLADRSIRGGIVCLTGINPHNVQEDTHLVNLLENIDTTIFRDKDYIESNHSSLHLVDVDMDQIPDSTMTIAISLLFSSIWMTTLRNIANWLVKENDRLTATSIELQKLDIIVLESTDFITITPPEELTSSCISTYNDRRMVIRFFLVTVSSILITIIDPKCTHKTFLFFFNQPPKLSKPSFIPV
ncbi:5-enolpyruvylshikimate-3-phosphate synthase [secondary endosymbiont of Heteropsylla cubana]|uniref:5-enolpyruvylshikimate-3-phosphate synthase n=1 Tax=secondary endosymbiont of Heteropsylla cubana TaxID=134287 RepID=J3TYB6_9ENTR|nr:5-enolpyruvylshikimate-3-phosphate synthase [secondary endosymbiont of Heteropsylla cubana]AFP85350.1 5-enolpyruvylshikimate-3-phosphate synthase [secondary endosymbiont of Heteropsylla cubana]